MFTRVGIVSFLAGIVLAGGVAVNTLPPVLEGFLTLQAPVVPVDALVLMAGSAEQRLPAAARLYHEGVTARILLANDGNRGAWSTKHHRNLYLAEWAQEDLLRLGVPLDAITILNFTASGSIYDALNARAQIQADGTIHSLLVVTSDYHTRRTLWTFKRVFEDAPLKIGVSPVFAVVDSRFQRLRILGVEFLKLLYYQVRYGLSLPAINRW